MHDPSQDLVAVATPPGRGGVGCVRISGPRAHDLARKLFRPAGGAQARGAEAGRVRFGRFLGRDRAPMDHGYLVLFPAERSYTREPSAELWAHGSPAVLAELVAGAVEHGAVPAGPGEFTYRALRNGRFDLARAEAVRDLVEARTLYQARVAFAQVEGALSRKLAPLRERLTALVARGEAAVEFADESETHLAPRALIEGIEGALAEARELLRGFRTGRVVREGATVVITGRPNVGKSSLFNRLLAEERAIVTEIPGTTRDTLEETLDLDGVPVRLVDTAGLREPGDPVESEGVRRAERARAEADLVLLVLDGGTIPASGGDCPRTGTDHLYPSAREQSSLLPGTHGGRSQASGASAADCPPNPARTIVVMNKSDLPEVAAAPLPAPDAIRVSARTGQGLEDLRHLLREELLGAGPVEDPVLTDARHARALERAAEALDRAREAAVNGIPDDLVLEDLHVAIRHVGEITGEVTNDEIYDRIFSTFCIGK